MADADDLRSAVEDADLGPWAAVCWALLVAATWVAFTLMLRGAMSYWPVSTGGAFSRALSLALLAGFLCARPGGAGRLRVRGVTRWVVLMGLVSITINYLMFAALKRTTATHLSLLSRLDLVFVLLIGTVFGLQRLALADWLVAAMMLGGAAMVMEVQKLTWFQPGGGEGVSDRVLGDVMVVGVALGLAVNAFIIRRIMRRTHEDVVAFYNMSFSTTGFFVLAAICGFPLPEAGINQAAPWLWLCGLGLFASVSLRLYYHLLRRMAVWRLRTLLLFSPILSVIAEWAIWRDRPSGLQCLGMAVTVAGAAVLLRRPARAQAAVVGEDDCRPPDPT